MDCWRKRLATVYNKYRNISKPNQKARNSFLWIYWLRNYRSKCVIIWYPWYGAESTVSWIPIFFKNKPRLKYFLKSLMTMLLNWGAGEKQWRGRRGSVGMAPVEFKILMQGYQTPAHVKLWEPKPDSPFTPSVINWSHRLVVITISFSLICSLRQIILNWILMLHPQYGT